MSRNCGECLWNRVEVVELLANGVCPQCGADYGPEPGAQNGGATDQQTTGNPSKSSESTGATVAPPRGRPTRRRPAND